MKSSRDSKNTYRSKRSQRGEAEMALFAIVVLIAGLISGTFWILQWVKENKHSEREARKLEYIRQMKMSQYANRRDPAEYFARCEKPFWALLQTKYECTVLPESYGELWLHP
jgi:cell division protein FtsI/penicillin-binding protein 2